MNVTLNGKCKCTHSELFFFRHLNLKCAETGLCHFCTNRQSPRDTGGVKYIHLL